MPVSCVLSQEIEGRGRRNVRAFQLREIEGEERAREPGGSVEL